MYKRGIDCFTRAGVTDFAKLYQIQLKLLEENKPENKKLGRPVREVIGNTP